MSAINDTNRAEINHRLAGGREATRTIAREMGIPRNELDAHLKSLNLPYHGHCMDYARLARAGHSAEYIIDVSPDRARAGIIAWAAAYGL